MNERTPWIISTFALGALCIVVALVPIRLAQQLAEEAPTVARQRAQCDSARAALVLARRNVFNPDRPWAQTTYDAATRYEWLEVRACSAVPVDDSCEPGDRPCMLHALDWALVNVR